MSVVGASRSRRKRKGAIRSAHEALDALLEATAPDSWGIHVVEEDDHDAHAPFFSCWLCGGHGDDLTATCAKCHVAVCSEREMARRARLEEHRVRLSWLASVWPEEFIHRIRNDTNYSEENHAWDDWYSEPW